MKKILIVSMMMVAGIAQAGHPRCAGSYEPAKCEALEAKLAAETPDQRTSRIKNLESARKASTAEVVRQPTAPTYRPTLYVGMFASDASQSSWGSPNSISYSDYGPNYKTEFWSYGNGKYVSIVNGKVSSIHY